MLCSGFAVWLEESRGTRVVALIVGGRAAQADVAHDLPLLAGNNMAPALKDLVLMSMKDIGHFEPIFSHRVPLPPWEALISRMGRSLLLPRSPPKGCKCRGDAPLAALLEPSYAQWLHGVGRRPKARPACQIEIIL